VVLAGPFSLDRREAMKVLRCTMYPSPDPKDAVTVTISEKSGIEPLDKIATRMLMPGTFVVSDIFEVPDTTDELHIALLGMKRLEDSARAQDERNMAISYYWNAMQLKKLAPGGTLANPKPAPLYGTQIEMVLLQLVKHPDYYGQTIMCIASDHEMVIINRNGTIIRNHHL
jgi:hypothetical protein